MDLSAQEMVDCANAMSERNVELERERDKYRSEAHLLTEERDRLQTQVNGLQFIINRSAELLERGHRDEVEHYLSLAKKELGDGTD